MAFLTVGQSPRDDIVPELLEQIAVKVDHREFGALDGLDAVAIAAGQPQDGDQTLCTRLRNGTEVRIGKRWLTTRLQTILHEIDTADFDLVVLLCTENFEGLCSKTLMIDAHIDAKALAASGRRLGIIWPTAEQISESGATRYGSHTSYGHFSPHAAGERDDELTAAATEVAVCDLVIMDCMAYTEDMKDRLQKHISSPVIMARDLLADKINLLLQH